MDESHETAEMQPEVPIDEREFAEGEKTVKTKEKKLKQRGIAAQRQHYVLKTTGARDMSRTLGLTQEEESKLKHAKLLAREHHAKVVRILDKSSVIPATGLLPTSHISGAELKTVALNTLNRVYIGNISLDVSEVDLHNILKRFGKIRSLSLGIDVATQKHKGYAFVEFGTPEAAALALERLNGVRVADKSIRVGRPQNFPTEMIKDVPAAPRNRIYVSNVNEFYGEEEFAQVFAAFGKVKACVLVGDRGARTHSGYGYVEFGDARTANNARVGMDGFELGGVPLCVGRVVVGGDMPDGVKPLEKKEVPAAVIEAAAKINENLIDAAKLSQSRVVVLSNLVSAQEADQEFETDMRAELATFGHMIDFATVETALQDPSEQIRVFAVYSTPAEAQAAVDGLNGRWFGGRQVDGRIYSEEKYGEKVFDN